MAREVLEEDVKGIKAIGMPCWRDKNFICGNFKNWDEFIKWDGEKFCKNICSDRPGLEFRKKLDSQGKSEAVRYNAKVQYEEWLKLRKEQTVPFKARKVI